MAESEDKLCSEVTVGNFVDSGDSAEACSSCGSGNPKYRCPQCERRSCSLICVKSHKLKNACTGQQNKTKYVMKSEYNEKHLLNDYRFLEEANRVADNALRDHRNKNKFFSRNVKQLRSKAAERGVTLKLMPVGFKKRMENTTCYRYRTKLMLWRMKLIFPQADAEYVETRVSERVKMITLLEKYIDPSHVDPVFKQRLKMYHTGTPADVGVFFENHSSHPRFFQIDTTNTLADVLRGKVVSEYPAFHVVLSGHFAKYLTDDESPVAKRQRIEECSTKLTYEKSSDEIHSEYQNVNDISSYSSSVNTVETGLRTGVLGAGRETAVVAETCCSCVDENCGESHGGNGKDTKEITKEGKSEHCVDNTVSVSENKHEQNGNTLEQLQV